MNTGCGTGAEKCAELQRAERAGSGERSHHRAAIQLDAGLWTLEGGLPADKTAEELPFHVVAYDFGAKRNILRMLVDRGCRLTVVPAQTPAEEVLKMAPDGIFLSNGG